MLANADNMPFPFKRRVLRPGFCVARAKRVIVLSTLEYSGQHDPFSTTFLTKPSLNRNRFST